MQNSVLNCQTCGGPLQYSPDGLTATCPYCGNKYNFAGAKSEALTLALNRAGAMRIACDFDGAIREYKLITERNPADSEAWWGLALSKYGIEYVRDARSGNLVPTCRRTVSGSILRDEYFLNAVKHASPPQAENYKRRAAVIDRLQGEIKRRLAEESPYDVFLCFRSSDEDGNPTRERAVARRIYDELTRRGIRTFFSEITLMGRLGEDFEPIIYKALYSCKFFVLVACSAENINAPWVKNEWSRFRDREEEEHLSDACCAVFGGISPNDLPPFLRSRQGIDLKKYPAGGYEIELADGIQNRFFAAGASRARSSAPASLLASAQKDLAAELYESAYSKFMQVTEAAPDCAEAWWGRFLAGHNAYSAGLAAQNITYEEALALKTDECLKNAELYGDAAMRDKVTSFRRMCAFRCNELAAESSSRLKSVTEQLNALAARRKKLAAEREREFRRLESDRKTAASKAGRTGLLMIFPAAFFLLMFGIMSFAMEEPVMLYVALGMAAMCGFAGLMSYFGMKHNATSAAERIPRRENRLREIDAELDGLTAEREKLECRADECKRRSDTFRGVFRN